MAGDRPSRSPLDPAAPILPPRPPEQQQQLQSYGIPIPVGIQQQQQNYSSFHPPPEPHRIYSTHTPEERRAENSMARQIIMGMVMLVSGTGAGIYGHGKYNDADRQHGGQLTVQQVEIKSLKDTVIELKGHVAELKDLASDLRIDVTKLVTAQDVERENGRSNRNNRGR